MERITEFLVLSLFLLVAACGFGQTGQPKSEGMVRARTQFEFTVDAPFAQTAPLFGANEERKWAQEWNPQFVYPLPARDEPGMVFKVEHGEHSSTWINTAFDVAAGHIQYAYVLNDAMTTLIDIQLSSINDQQTKVKVSYERTALMPEANEHVKHFAKADEGAAKEWRDAINGYFAKFRASPIPAAAK